MTADETTLFSKTANGFAWSVIERIGTQGAQFIISVFLARLLSPQVFGLTAILSIFITLGQTITDSGFGFALIKKKNATYTDECSVFYLNVVLGIGLATALFLAAPAIAVFFKQDALTAITKVMSVNFIINSFGIIQSTLLTKDVDFKTQMKIGVVTSMVSGGIGIFCAWQGCGVWSLVAQSVSSTSIRTVLLWVMRSWRPGKSFSFKTLREMFQFGSKLMLSGILDTLYTNIIQVFIGRSYSPSDLAFYNRAFQLQQIPVGLVATSAKRVSYPIFARIGGENEKLAGVFKRVQIAIVAITMPMMAIVFFVSEPLILVFFTSKWSTSIGYLRLLTVLGIFYPIHMINLNVLIAQGHSDKYFGIELFKKALGIGVLFITTRYGIEVMIYGQIFSSIFGLFVNTYFTKKFIGYSIFLQIRDLVPCCVATGCSCLAMAGVRYISSSGLAGIFLIPLAGLAAYIAAGRLLKIEVVLIALNHASGLMGKFKHRAD